MRMMDNFYFGKSYKMIWQWKWLMEHWSTLGIHIKYSCVSLWIHLHIDEKVSLLLSLELSFEPWHMQCLNISWCFIFLIHVWWHALLHKKFASRSLIHEMSFLVFLGPTKTKHLPEIKHDIIEEERCSSSLHPINMKKMTSNYFKTNPLKKKASLFTCKEVVVALDYPIVFCW